MRNVKCPARYSCRALWSAWAVFLFFAADRPHAMATPPSATGDVPSAGSVAPGKRVPFPISDYLGDEECRSCHQELVNSYHRTAHFITSRLATRDSILGSFSPGSNVLKTINTNLYFEMDATDAGFFQKAVLKRPTDVLTRQERFEIAIGSGRKGQTYAFRDGDKLFQLPISYWTDPAEWVNSPGYPEGSVIFSRAITPRCLECHATTFESKAPPPNQYNIASIVLGMTCEKCHGPGREHVARYRSKTPPKNPVDGAIINATRFSRDQQLDACGLCHAGGNPRPEVASLSFVPGDVLADFVNVPNTAPTAHVDVHGGTVQLFKRSRCFQNSPTMTCTTCHDVHKPQRDLVPYAANCLACHKIEKCGEFAKLGHAIDAQCVVCHMPLQTTDLIISSANGKKVQPKVRNHQIGIYPDVQLP